MPQETPEIDNPGFEDDEPQLTEEDLEGRKEGTESLLHHTHLKDNGDE